MNKINDGGPVYPEIYWNEDEKLIIKNKGISYRKWLAGLAMQSIISSKESLLSVYNTAQDTGLEHPKVIAKICLEIADGLIEEVEKY